MLVLKISKLKPTKKEKLNGNILIAIYKLSNKRGQVRQLSKWFWNCFQGGIIIRDKYDKKKSFKRPSHVKLMLANSCRQT